MNVGRKVRREGAKGAANLRDLHAPLCPLLAHVPNTFKKIDQ